MDDPEKWVDMYGDHLYSYAFYRMADKSVAEELVQETFLAALAARKSFEGRSSLKTWFISILKNKITDHLRKKYRDSTTSLESYSENYMDDFFDEGGGWLVHPDKWKEIPHQQYEQHEFFEILMRCLSGLSGKQGAAFRMRELDDSDSEEICKVLGISSTNYWVIMHRARLFMRKCLEHNWFTNA